ncbi:MAG: ATP-binding protein [Nitrososphaerales archaeon]
MSIFSVIPELRIGSIVEVAGTVIRLELDGRISDLTRTYGGRVYPIGQFASVIKIHYGRTVLLAYVRLLRMRSELAREEGQPAPSPSEDSRIIEADLFGEANWQESEQSLDLHRGVRTYPLPGQGVYLTTQDELRKIYEGIEAVEGEEVSPMVPIGSYVGSEQTTCYADINKLFGQHSAILGSTGSGKSATVAAIIQSLLEHKGNRAGTSTLRPRIIIIDPHNEYGNSITFGNRSIVYRAYSVVTDSTTTSTRLLKLPYWLMTGEEFRELVIAKTEREATSENNIVYKALTHARLVERGWIEKTKSWEGVDKSTIPDPAEPRPLNKTFESHIASYDRDMPDPFSLEEFVNHIREEQGVVPKAN